jgi:hypothetical protein
MCSGKASCDEQLWRLIYEALRRADKAIRNASCMAEHQANGTPAAAFSNALDVLRAPGAS